MIGFATVRISPYIIIDLLSLLYTCIMNEYYIKILVGWGRYIWNVSFKTQYFVLTSMLIIAFKT